MALAQLAGTGVSADAASGDLATHSHAALAGSAGSLDSTFGVLGAAVVFNGVSNSSNSATGTLQIGPQLGFGSSSDSATGFLSTGPFSPAFSADFAR